MSRHLMALLIVMYQTNCDTFNHVKVGPFNAFLRHIEECHQIGTGDVRVSVRVKKFNRTTVAADFNVTLKVRYDDRISIDVALAQLTNGGFKQNFYTQNFPKACSSMVKWVPKMWEQVLSAMHAPPCPIPKGFYSARDFTTTEVQKNVTVFFYNRYRAKLEFKKEGKLLGCFNTIVDIVPKKKQH